MHTNCKQIAHKLHTNCTQINHKFPKIVNKFPTNIPQIVHRLQTNCTLNELGLDKYFTRVSHRLHTDWTLTANRVCKDCTRMAQIKHGLHSNVTPYYKAWLWAIVDWFPYTPVMSHVSIPWDLSIGHITLVWIILLGDLLVRKGIKWERKHWWWVRHKKYHNNLDFFIITVVYWWKHSIEQNHIKQTNWTAFMKNK